MKEKECNCGNKIYNRNKFCNNCIAEGKHLIKKDFVSMTSHSSKRRYLLKNLPHECQICFTSVWNNKPVPLCMDHIDGNSDNNDRSNLRLICLNCDGLLPTFKARNKGNGRYSRRERYKEGKSY